MLKKSEFQQYPSLLRRTKKAGVCEVTQNKAAGIDAVSLLHKRISRGKDVQMAQNCVFVKLAMSTRIVERKSAAQKNNC